MKKIKKNTQATKRTTKPPVEKKPVESNKAPTDKKKTTSHQRDAKGTKGEAKPKKLGVLGAAAKVLEESGQPMTCSEMVKTMLDKGLWQTGGKTPAATLYAAVIREISKKGDASRFAKVDRGMFTLKA